LNRRSTSSSICSRPLTTARRICLLCSISADRTTANEVNTRGKSQVLSREAQHATPPRTNLRNRHYPEPKVRSNGWQNSTRGMDETRTKEELVKAQLSFGTYQSHHLRREPISRSDRDHYKTIVPLRPAAAWAIAMLASSALWWGIWDAVSSLASAWPW
jgi:hypothetical protein